jgi:hypothetical protein
MSLLGALTPLVKAAPKYWMRAVIAYTLAGCLTAGATGFLFGLLGQSWKGNAISSRACYLLMAAASLILACREWGWVRFPLPELKRQTEKTWVHEFGFIGSAAMWGAHIGLGFATRITYGGYWVLVVAAVASGKPSYGATLLLVYWFGRTFSVWIAPAISRYGIESHALPKAILSAGTVSRRLVGLTLCWSGAVATLQAGHVNLPALLGHL